MAYNFTSGLDIAEVVTWAFFIFFLGLVIYLRREDHREGYPLEDDVTGKVDRPAIVADPSPKSYRLPFGRGFVYQPAPADRDGIMYKGRRTGRRSGSPIEPVGDPLHAGIGPGAYAIRAERPDINMEGHARIVPLRVQPDFDIAPGDPDPRGWPIVGADRVIAGTISDIWIDTADRLVRYYEVLTPSGKSVLAPMFMSSVDKRRRSVEIDALLGHQFEGAPETPTNDQITLNQEERVQAFFGGGYLYATPSRAEPLL